MPSYALPSDHLLRHARVAAISESIVDLDVDALPAIELPGSPGWLTGEPLLAQGVETTMPNLPEDLPLPPVSPRPFRCRVAVVGPDALRVTIAPADARVFREPAEWLGIVVTPTIGTIDARIEQSHDDDGIVDAVVVTTGHTSLTIGLDPFRLQLEGSRTVDATHRPLVRTAERLRQVAGFPMAPPVRWCTAADGQRHIELSLELAADEQILGFGEQFSRLVKNGQRLVLRCEDALGTGTGMAYKPAPVWQSTAGYAGFINTGATVVADVGHERPSVLALDVADDALDLYLFADPDPSARLLAHTALTGRGARPPVWAFGYWMGRCRYHHRDEVVAVADEMRRREVPIDVLHTDPDWLVVDRLNTDFIWNEERFGPLADFAADLADRQTRLSVWEVPYIDPLSPKHDEADAAGHLARTADGKIAALAGTPTPDGRPRALLDVTNPAAVQWWQDLHRSFLDAGVAVFKTDFGEGCPDDVAAVDGTPSNHLHNLFPLRYNGAVSDVIADQTRRAPLVWGRSGWAGSQRYPGQWGGDAESTVAGMQATLRGGLSHALSAPGFWSHDIGGFFGPELTPGLYVRWTQFGALSPLMRAHGLRPREPWEFGDDAFEICREWIRTRYSLLPYLWRTAGEVASAGLPMMRPMWLEFPDDPIAPSLDDQYLLGSDLLVAPILDDGMRTVNRRVYLPAGRWFDLATDECHEGPGFIDVTAPITTMPVFVRDGAAIARLSVDASVRWTDDTVDLPWTVHRYGDADEAAIGDAFGGGAPTVLATVRHG